MLLASIYMLTWSGRINSNDALLLLNASGSLVRYGDMRADLGAGNTPTSPGQLIPGPGFESLPEIRVEPLQAWLAAPLYWLALRLPGPGLAHTVYLFNVLVSAAAVSLFFLYARMLGHSERAALLASLLLGLATIVWPYSDSFFQAPLTLLMILLVAFQLERWRRSGWRAPMPALLALLALLLMPLARQSALLALPALAVLVLPDLRSRLRVRQWLLLVSGMLMAPILVALVLRSEWSRILNELGNRLAQLDLAFSARVLHSYLISPGGSLWGTSPVLLLALPGAWLLWRSRRVRYVLVALLMLAGFALTFAFWQGIHWFGGLSWPPRFLIPAVPFLLLPTLPVLERVTQGPRPRWLLPAVALLTGYSLWVQISATSLPWEAYGSALPPEAGGLGEWGGGLNLLRWLRWVVIPGLWAELPLDFAWLRLQALSWPLLFGASATFALWQILRQLRRHADTAFRPTRLSDLLQTAAMLLLMLFALALLPPDPLYDAPNEALAGLLQRLPQETVPGDVVLLNDLELERYLVNYAKLDWPRLVSLPFHPGEGASPEQPPEIRSDNPEVLLQESAAQQIMALAGSRERIWLLAGNGPYLPWSIRPVERFMAENYYILREIEGGPRARLLEYDTMPAPDSLLPGVPDWRADLRYGEHIELTGYSLPRGLQYQPGESLPVTFYWQSLTRLTHSWKVAWFLAKADSPPAAQGQDGAMQAGFAPTSGWRPAVPVLDNRALRLPLDMPSGDYRILVVLYRIDEAGEIIRLATSGEQTLEGHVGVLPTRIRVAQGASSSSRSG